LIYSIVLSLIVKWEQTLQQERCYAQQFNKFFLNNIMYLIQIKINKFLKKEKNKGSLLKSVSNQSLDGNPNSCMSRCRIKASETFAKTG